MKLKTLRSSKTPILKNGYHSNNQNTTTTEPIFLYQNGTFLGGGRRSDFYSTVLKVSNTLP